MHRYRFLISIILLTFSVACTSSTRHAETVRSSPRVDRPLNHGAALYLQGCYTRALEFFQEAHERYTVLDNLPGIASSLNSMANVYYQLDDMQGALRSYTEALAVYRQLEDRDGAVRVLSNQAAALVRSGQLEEAAHTLDQADALAGAAPLLLTLRLKNRALIAMARNETAEAQRLLTQALAVRRAGDDASKAAAHYALGRLLVETGRPAEAEPHLQEALTFDRAGGAYPSVAKDLAALGVCYARLGDHARAVGFFLRSAKIYALLQDTLRTQELIASLKDSADRAGVDIQASLHWIEEWLEGRTEGTLCR